VFTKVWPNEVHTSAESSSQFLAPRQETEHSSNVILNGPGRTGRIKRTLIVGKTIFGQIS
jgi:hypothetical protein